MLEPLARGIPVVSTRSATRPRTTPTARCRLFCVDPADAQRAAFAILRLVMSYARYRDLFAANAQVLRDTSRRRSAAAEHGSLETAAFGEPGE
jgi:hypothetical protein